MSHRERFVFSDDDRMRTSYVYIVDLRFTVPTIGMKEDEKII